MLWQALHRSEGESSKFFGTRAHEARGIGARLTIDHARIDTARSRPPFGGSTTIIAGTYAAGTVPRDFSRAQPPVSVLMRGPNIPHFPSTADKERDRAMAKRCARSSLDITGVAPNQCR